MRRRDFLVSACMTIAGAHWASAGQLPQTFVNLYRPALNRLREAYSKVTVEGTIRVELPREEKSSEQGFVMRADGKKRRLDLRTLAQQGMGLKVGATEMSMATPYGSLNTFTNPDSKFFDDAQQRKYDGIVADIDRRCLVTYPYALDSQSTILDMLQSPAVKVKSVKWTRSQGQPMVQVDYEQDGEHAGFSGTWDSMLILSPEDGWALRSFTRTLQGTSSQVSQRGELQYAGIEDGAPLLQSISVETSQGGHVIRREDITVKDTDFGAPNHYLFDSFTF